MRIRSLLTSAAAVAALAVGVPLTMLATAPPAFACSCVTSEFGDFVERADVVFAGTVTGEGDPRGGGGASGRSSSADLVDWRFQVDAVHKGEATADQMVTSGRSSASCGFEFAVGRTYLVFGTVFDGELRTSLCEGTAELSNIAADDVASLGPGVVPAVAEQPAADTNEPAEPTSDASVAGASDSSESTNAGMIALVVLTGGGIVITGAVVALLIVRRRRDATP